MMTILEIIFLVTVFLIVTIIGTVLFFTTVHDVQHNYWWWLVAFFSWWILALILIFAVQSDLKAKVRALFKRSRKDKQCRPPNQVCRENLQRDNPNFRQALQDCDTLPQTSPCTENIVAECSNMIRTVHPEATAQFEDFKHKGKTAELLNVCYAIANS